MQGGESGASLVPGKAAESLLANVLDAEAEPHMPPKKQLAEKDIRTITKWINAGATWDEQLLKPDELRRDIKFDTAPTNHNASYAIALSPDDKTLAFSRGKLIHVYDVSGTNLASISRLNGFSEPSLALGFSPDGSMLYAGGFRKVVVYSGSNWTDSTEIKEHIISRVSAIAIHSNHLFVADGVPTQSGLIHVFSNHIYQATIEGHTDTIYSLAVSADGTMLASGGADKLVQLWELPSNKLLGKMEAHMGHVLGLTFNHDGKWLASGGADKTINIWDTSTRKQDITLTRLQSIQALAWKNKGTNLFAVSENGLAQVFSDFKGHSGAQSSDDTRKRDYSSAGELLHCIAASEDGKRLFAGSDSGIIHIWDSNGKIKSRIEPFVETIPVVTQTKIIKLDPPLSFARDILPLLGQAGCNAGACHAKPDGQNGFKLSVFAYDPRGDYDQIVRLERGRRANLYAPEESLILRKATQSIDHEGGKRFEINSDTYRTIAAWLRQGAPFAQTNEALLAGLELTPEARTLRKNSRLQLKVEALYSDGSRKDVTSLTDFGSNDKEIAEVNHKGLVRSKGSSGEGVVVARFMGHVDVARVIVPPDKMQKPAVYTSLPVNNEIDKLVYARLQSLGILPSEKVSDAEFLRRASLDITGVIPTAKQARNFLADTNINKRGKYIDELLEDPRWADYWTIKWGDLIRPNTQRVGVKPVYLLDLWLRESFRANKPYDQFVRELLTAQGSTHKYGPAVIFRDKREPADAGAFVSQIFLGVRLDCAKCHHHPNEKWSQSDYYQLAAYFSNIKRKGQGISAPISGEAEFIWSAPGGQVKHPVTGEIMKPKPPDGQPPALSDTDDPRESLVSWMTSPDNPYFAKAIANRVWAEFFGKGIVDPVDDFRVSNPPSNEALLDWLAKDFIAHGYDLKHLMRRIANSHVYQLSSLPNKTNEGDNRNFSRYYRKRLSAEVLHDAICEVTDTPPKFDGLPLGAGAMETWNHKFENEFLDAFGRLDPSAECPCERDRKPSMVQALHLMNSSQLNGRISNNKGFARQLADSKKSEKEIIEDLYLTTYSRYPTEEEIQIAEKPLRTENAKRREVVEDLLWSLINSAEFVFNH